MSMKVSAVIVTYNRLESLKECINSIKNQTRKLDEIIVVNNNSADGTLAWLNEQSDITFITQANSGSAGGQYTGIKTAFERGADWIWCMDDDGKPVNNCLEKLMECAFSNNIVLHPLVLSYDYQTFSFGCWLYPNTNKHKLLRTFDEVKELINNNEKYIPSFGTPFNGTLIPRDIVHKVGFPNKKYFIWGEESEYMLRINKYGFNSYIVIDSIFTHPHDPLIFTPIKFEKKNWWKLYYLFRNRRENYYYSNTKIVGTIKYLKNNLQIISKILFGNYEDKFFKIRVMLLATIHSLFGKYGKYNI